ncbi:insulinase family protein [bacterium]|nr:insulinase family protein [bacterium]
MRQLLLGILVGVFIGTSAMALETSVSYLENGLPVVLVSDSQSTLVTVRVIVGSGSMREGASLGSGLSHYLEHLVAGGTTSKRSEAAYTRWIDRIGGAYNAVTSTDYTGYFIHTSPDYIEDAVTILSEWMQYSAFKHKEFRREQSVILKEMERGDANVARQFYQKSQRFFYRYHPMGTPVIGYRKSLLAVTPDQLRSYYQRHYVPENMVLSIAGPLDIQKTKALVRTVFGSISQGVSPSAPIFNEPRLTSPRSLLVTGNTEVTRVSLRFPTVSLHHPDLYPLDLLDMVLSNGKTSLLHKALVEDEKLAFSVQTYSATPALTDGYFDVVMETEAVNVTAAVAVVWKQIRSVQAGHFRRSRLKQGIRTKLSEDIFGVKTANDRSQRAGLSMLYTGTPDFFERYSRTFRDVKKGDVVRVAKAYLRPEMVVKTVMVPDRVASFNSTESPDQGVPDPPQTTVLSNGIRVMWFPEDSLPQIQLGLYGRGGLKDESVSSNGVATLLSSMLGDGSKRYSVSESRRLIASSGAWMRGSSGRNTVIFKAQLLKEDLDDVLPLFLDSYLSPKFDQDTFDEAKRQQLKSIRTQDDQWFGAAMRRFFAHFYKGHSYGWSKLGTKSVVEGLTKKEVIQFHLDGLDPSQLILTVSGDYDQSTVLALLEKRLKRYADHWTVRKQVDQPIIGHQKSKVYRDEIPQSVGVVVMGFDSVSVSQSDEQVKIDVVDAVLSGMRYPGGRLHPRLRGEGMVYVVHAQSIPLLDTGMFQIYALTSQDKVKTVRRIINEEVRLLTKKGITKSELILAKSQVKHYYLDQLDSLSSRSQYHALQSLYLVRPFSLKERLDILETITTSDVQMAAKRLFRRSQTLLLN